MRYGIWIILFALVGCSRNPNPVEPSTRVEVFTLFADSEEKAAWDHRVYPQIAPFVKKWNDAGFSFSKNRLAIEIEPTSAVLKNKKFSDFYGPEYPKRLNALAPLLEDPLKHSQLLSAAIDFAARFPPVFWSELESSNSKLDSNLTHEIERQMGMANQPAPELSDNLNRQGGIGSMRYLAAVDFHFIYLGRSGEFKEQPFLQPGVVFHEITHALLNSRTQRIKEFRVLDEAIADAVAQTTIDSACVLKLEVPGKHGDGCYRQMDRPSLPMAQWLWETGPNVAEYRNGQTIRRFLWDLYREVGLPEFERSLSVGIQQLDEILASSTVGPARRAWAKRDPFIAESIYQRETFRSAQFFFEAVCSAERKSQVCDRMNSYLGLRNGTALENLERFAPSQLNDGKTSDGSLHFYRDEEDRVWKARRREFPGEEFSEVRSDREPETQTVWLRLKSKAHCVEWLSTGKVTDCRD